MATFFYVVGVLVVLPALAFAVLWLYAYAFVAFVNAVFWVVEKTERPN